MDNEDGLNFSYAYGGTSAASAPSWNPALRPDHEDAPPNATATKSIELPSNLVEPTAEPHAVQPVDVEESEDEELPTAPAIPSHISSSVLEEKQILNSDDDFFDRYGAPDVPQSAPQWETEQTNGHAFGSVTEPAEADVAEDTGIEQGRLENGGAINGTHQPAEQEWPASEDPFDLEAPQAHPEDEYEHQGETTLLEEAVAESAEAPLLADAEPSTDDWGTTGEVFDVGGVPQDAPLPTPHAEAIGTNVGDETIGETRVGGNAGDDTDWGTGDDNDFFGGGATQPPAGSRDSAAADPAWDLPSDDDFLDDNDDNSAPKFDLEDDDEFLEDEPLEDFAPSTQPASSANKYAPQTSQVPQAAPSPYGVQGPQFTDFSQMDRSKPVAPSNVAYGAYAQPSPYQQQAARPQLSSSAQSFADKAKGGYASPYDLPEDIAPVKKRSAPRSSAGPTQQAGPPPPRSSSISSASRPPPPSNMSTSSLSPPTSSHSMQSPMSGFPPNALPKAAPSKASSSEFFAELPVTSKPRPSGRYTPQQSAQQTPQGPPTNFAPPHLPPKDRTGSWSSLRNEVLPDTGLIPQLQQPERLPVFPDQPTAPVRTNSLPVPQTAPPPAPSRYSPAPAAAPTANARYSPGPSTAPPTNARYSPAPPGQGPPGPVHTRFVSDPPSTLPRPPVQPYAPRTSSPLAFHTHSQEQQAQAGSADHSIHQHQAPGHHSMHSADGVPRAPLRHPLEGVSEVEEQEQSTIGASTYRSETPPPPRSGPSSSVGSPRKRSNYMPQYQSGVPSGMPPPARSQSQSPGTAKKKPLYNLSNLDRPASTGFGAQGSSPNVANIIPHKRQASIEYQFIPPADERVHDPLERWKGYPMFHWGLGGTVVTSFPKQIPRYGGGASMPMMKCSPGDIKIQTVKDAFPLSEDIAKFPGPLKAKGKKKDISAWLGKRIEGFEAYLQTPGLEHTTDADVVKRLEENLLLWRIMLVLVDNDGRLEGNAAAEAAVRKVLTPGDDAATGEDGAFATAAELVGITRSNTSTVQADPVDPRAVEELRTLLTKGDREKAVWHAVDQRLWAHAMLLSSTLNKDVWKQVVQEFVRKEIKKMGPNNQALAVLYEQFAGNSEDCIDELVPASARAGFQMVNTDGAGSTQNALQGLEKWRETLSLILSNRSDNDVTALLSLGRLLAGYGRIEAAHICFIFARSVALVAGVDNAQADVVLIGADHRSNPSDVGGNLDHILLTEVYEFALSLSSPGGTHVFPHLQSYKLAHAYTLAEYGQRSDAQSYCDAIAYSMKSTTKVSPYYNGSFIASLDDLSKRLSQSPKDGSSSWISKPSMEKVSSSLLLKFTSFVAGDDEDAASNHSGANEVGPFAKVAGNSPGITPSQSNTDLYGAYSGYSNTAPLPTPGNSRYAPSNAYAPRASIDQGQPRYEAQGRPSLDSNASSFGGRQPSDSYMPSPQFSGPYTPSQPTFSPPTQRMQAPKTNSYSPLKAEAPAAAISYGSPYQPTPPAEESTPSFGGYNPHQPSFETQPPSPPSEEQQTSNAYDSSSMGYEPPTSGYEPPSYQPYQPDEDDKPEEEQPKKKKSFMDDDEDDDLAAKAAALKKQQKTEADRKADEAFRAAAEADAQKDAAAKKGGGWLTGWFKKDPNAAPGPIKAKLGEENSFYYDPELKKWVNKKGGATEATKPIATPPPPRSGPPSRAVSGNSVTANHALGMGMSSSLGTSLPPSGPPTRPPTSQPPRSSSMPPPMSGPQSRASTPGIPSDSEGKASAPPLQKPSFPPSSGPPSRPGTGMSNASSIDDLLGAAGTRTGTVKKGKKRGGRYVDVMAQK